jgi:hypothetical protein
VSSKAVREAILQCNEINVVGKDVACHKKKRKIGSENIDQLNLRRLQLTMEKRRRQKKKKKSAGFSCDKRTALGSLMQVAASSKSDIPCLGRLEQQISQIGKGAAPI